MDLRSSGALARRFRWVAWGIGVVAAVGASVAVVLTLTSATGSGPSPQGHLLPASAETCLVSRPALADLFGQQFGAGIPIDQYNQRLAGIPVPHAEGCFFPGPGNDSGIQLDSYRGDTFEIVRMPAGVVNLTEKATEVREYNGTHSKDVKNAPRSRVPISVESVPGHGEVPAMTHAYAECIKGNDIWTVSAFLAKPASGQPASGIDNLVADIGCMPK